MRWIINAAALDLEAIPIVGLVKPPKKHNEISHLLRFGYKDKPIYFEAGFRRAQQIRNGTLKITIGFRRKRCETRDFISELTAIAGVADKRKMKLLRNFGSIERIAKASVEALKPIVGSKAAAQVFDHFERQRKLAPSAKD